MTTRTVGVSLERPVPDEEHKRRFRDAVQRTHHATLLATELLNLYVRDAFRVDGRRVAQ